MTKQRSKHKKTWLSYFEMLKNKSCEQTPVKPPDFDDFLKVNRFCPPFFGHIIPFIYLLDYSTGKYLNMSENFAGYKAEYFLKGGINHTIEIYEPAHFHLFNKEIFPERLEILKTINPEEHKNYIFTFNQCLRNKNGHYESFMQRNCFLSDEAGNPLFSMGMLINTNHHDNDKCVIQTVRNINAPSGNQPFFKKVYFLNEQDKLFTKREKEILLWITEGYSSKMIADKLTISENTVINHRRNMQQKTNLPNVTALVSYAIKNGII